MNAPIGPKGYLTRADAEAQGFAVDTYCYPWLAYKGPRFAPEETRHVYTDLEAELLAEKAAR